MSISFTALVAEIETAIRSNLRNFDNMYQAVNAIFHRDLDGKTPIQQNSYISWFMQHFGYKKFWFLRIPTSHRLQLISALAIARRFSSRSEHLAKLITAGDSVLKKDIGSFKVCFMLI